MINSINNVDGTPPIYTNLHLRYSHQKSEIEKQLSATHIKEAVQLKDAAKLGTILKKIGGGLSRHRP